MTLEKIQGRFYATAGSRIGEEWTHKEVVDNLVLEAVKRALDGERDGLTIDALICGEWRDHKLTEADLEELTAAYVKSLRACFEVLRVMCRMT